MQTLAKIVQAYAENHTEAAPVLLDKIYQETYAQVPMPHMIAGHLQGRLLAAFSCMLKPMKILEVGTYTGYSALCLLEGLHPAGILHTIDKNKDLETTVRGYFEQSGMAYRIKYHIGQAADIIPRINEVFDLVFIDADKKNYQLYYDLVLNCTRPGGFIIVDNVLWQGKVLTSTTEKPVSKKTKAIIDFNTKVHRDPRVANLLLPIRDGLMILRKK